MEFLLRLLPLCADRLPTEKGSLVIVPLGFIAAMATGPSNHGLCAPHTVCERLQDRLADGRGKNCYFTNYEARLPDRHPEYGAPDATLRVTQIGMEGEYVAEWMNETDQPIKVWGWTYLASYNCFTPEGQ
jgi:hypothetical protein